ncbi:MAG: phosphatase PAP2 family protein [Clostridia bacterium]|nr:phosphatase PAP2 family protein [Clostridia bacterium]
MEISILQFFENLRCGFGTVLAFIFSLFGETLFLVLLICLIYWIADKSLGEKLVIVSFSSMSVNAFLKTTVARPRPFTTGRVSRLDIDTPVLSTTDLHAYESFPSGHSQMSAGMFFTGAFHFRKKWAWILFPLLTLGVMLSRLYFGVHYPTDVIVGATLGIAFAWFWEYIFRKKEGWKYYILAGFALLSVILSVIAPSKSMLELCGCLCATAICLPIENKYIRFENAESGKKRIYRALVGIACVGVVYGAFSLLPFAFLELWGWKLVKYFLTVVTGVLLVPYLFKKLKI